MNMSSKENISVYKIVDSQGRLVIPLELREKADMHKGDVVEITNHKNGILITKLDIVKLNDNSLEALRNTVISSAKKLDRKSLLALAKRMVDLAEKEETNE